MTDLARAPLLAMLRAEAHRESIEIVLTDLAGHPVTVLDLIEPGRSFEERRAIARNITRRINRDSEVLSPEEGA